MEGPAAYSLNNVRRDERPKHSSGDLHSRLKTRKILGVGETDDGGVHRSKISQILGHNDQLFIRLPYGLRAWQLALAVVYVLLGLWAILHPRHLFQVALQTEAQNDLINLAIRLYGGALISLSIMHWTTLQSQDRDNIRMTLLSSIVLFVIQFLAPCWHLLTSSSSSSSSSSQTTPNIGEQELPAENIYSTFRVLSVSTIFASVNWYFLWHLTYRRSYGRKIDNGRKYD